MIEMPNEAKSSYGFDDLLKEVGLKYQNELKRKLNKVNQYYGFESKDINPFKEEIDNKNSKYEFQFESMPLLKVLINSIGYNPFSRKNGDLDKVDSKQLELFYKTLIEEIDVLPDYAKYEVWDSPVYINTLKERLIIPKLVRKISEFIVALEVSLDNESGDIMIYIYKMLDEWMLNAFENNYVLRTVKSSNAESIKKAHLPNIEEDDLNKLIEKDRDNTLDRFIANMIKEYIGLTGNTKKEIKSNLLNKKRKIKGLNYFFNVYQITDSESIRFLLESEIEKYKYVSEEKYEEFKDDTDQLIKKINACEYEDKLISKKAEFELKKWKESNKKEKSAILQRKKEERMTTLKNTIEKCKIELRSIEESDTYLEKYKTQMRIYERFFSLKKLLKENKKFVEASNLFLGQILAEKEKIK